MIILVELRGLEEVGSIQDQDLVLPTPDQLTLKDIKTPDAELLIIGQADLAQVDSGLEWQPVDSSVTWPVTVGKSNSSKENILRRFCIGRYLLSNSYIDNNCVCSSFVKPGSH